jgi:hypothetical protein
LTGYIILEKSAESATSDSCTELTGLFPDFSPHRMGDTISVKNQEKVPSIRHISHSRCDSTDFSRIIQNVLLGIAPQK